MSQPIIEKSKISLLKKFEPLAATKGSIWLDSTLSFEDRGRHSFIASEPVAEIVLTLGGTTVKSSGKTITGDSDLIWTELERLVNDGLTAVGFISYEASLPFLNVSSKADQLAYPLAHFFVYDKVEKIETTESFESETNFSPATAGEVKPAISKERFIESILKIKEHIKEGDIYQANFTTRFEIESKSDPFEIYKNLRTLNPAPYGGYLNFGNYRVISSSPERMFNIKNGIIKSAPIKGTIKIGATEKETAEMLATLTNSIKDKAELLMIVDLVRNDLGKIAEVGTVRVESLFKPELYSSLIHLVSDISARLKPGTTFPQIIKALLPGGSITGAPKKRAVEILEQLETVPRGVYTGAIGILNKETADFNLAIRTMVHQNGTYQIHAGGGIVADSDPEAEYEEMRLKAKNLLKAVGCQ